MIEFLQKYILIYLAVVSVAAFATFGIDKRKAKKHKWRIRESTLILLDVIGGAAGGLAAMFVFHHKTKHPKFYAAAILSAALWAFILYKIYA